MPALGRSKLLSASGSRAWDYFHGSVAHQAIQFQLTLFGGSMYQYHSATGRWPASLDDLAQTSLPQRSYVWRETASTFVFLWPKNLRADPKDNDRVLLAYDNGSLFSKLGQESSPCRPLSGSRAKPAAADGACATLNPPAFPRLRPRLHRVCYDSYGDASRSTVRLRAQQESGRL
jgi:hypothetical protein